MHAIHYNRQHTKEIPPQDFSSRISHEKQQSETEEAAESATDDGGEINTTPQSLDFEILVIGLVTFVFINWLHPQT